jgi:hypothetical protein
MEFAMTAQPHPQHPRPALAAAPDETEELVRALKLDEALAARILYRRFAAGVRFLLRRIHPTAPVENLVLSALIDASRKLRQMKVVTMERATATVLECTRTQARFLPAAPESSPLVQIGLNLRQRSEIVNAVVTSLTETDRQILLRSFVLRQQDPQIASEMSIPLRRVSQARAEARMKFRSFSERITIN